MPTANEDYWNNFSVTDTDIERLYGYVLERGEPVPTRDLVHQVVEARVRDEEIRRARYSQHATLYQPKLEYELGQRLIFSELHDAEGIVSAIRPSDNPRIPPFQVITVQLQDGQRREFAAKYELPHPLNEDRAAVTVTTDLTVDQVLDQYGAQIEAMLLVRLRRDKEFVEQDGTWLLRGLFVSITEFNLNLAEAAIEQSNSVAPTSIPTDELAQISEVRAENAKRSTLFFSFEHALRNDERFVNVGPRDEPRWFLSRLQSVEAREVPRILQMPSQPPHAFALPPELEALVEELEGEADVSGVAAPKNGLTPIISLALTYPHRRAGTLPLTSAVRAFFPETDNPSMLITLVDAAKGTRFPGWYVREGNYLAGLKAWYDQNKLNPGAYVQLTKSAEPLTVKVEYQPQRERSLWVRVARVDAGQLTFMQLRKPLAHKYDEEMLIVVGDQAALDQLHASNRPDRSLEILLTEIFPELAKLVPGGRVHAKTLFSAVNFAKRVGPRAVFTALVESTSLVSLGGGYFVMEAARDFVR